MYDPDLFEGDMILSHKQKEAIAGYGRASIGNQRSLWPGGVMPYTIDSSLSKYLRFIKENQILINISVSWFPKIRT